MTNYVQVQNRTQPIFIRIWRKAGFIIFVCYSLYLRISIRSSFIQYELQRVAVHLKSPMGGGKPLWHNINIGFQPVNGVTG